MGKHGTSSDFTALSAEQAKIIISFLGFSNKKDYFKHINKRLDAYADCILPPIKSIGDLSRITLGLGVRLDELLGMQLDKERIARIYTSVYPGERIDFPEARVRLVMKFADYLFPEQDRNSVQDN